MVKTIVVHVEMPPTVHSTITPSMSVFNTICPITLQTIQSHFQSCTVQEQALSMYYKSTHKPHEWVTVCCINELV